VSALMEAVTRLKELVEGEQADFLGGRGRYECRGEEQVGSRNGYEPGRIRIAEGTVQVRVPQVRGEEVPFRSTLWASSTQLRCPGARLVTDLRAGLSTPRRRGRLPGSYRRAADLPLRGGRDH
jgi:hypothetical protein